MTSGSFDSLPDILREIAEAAGLDAAMKLAQAYGGTEVKIPRRITKSRHWLVECVGRKAADAICERFRVEDADGKPIAFEPYIPQAGTGYIATGRRRLVKDIEAGKMSMKEAARRNGFTERTARRVKSRIADPGTERQPDLFGQRNK